MFYSHYNSHESHATQEELEFYSDQNGSLADLLGDTVPPLEELRPILLSLPKADMDLLLMKIAGSRQVEIAEHIGISQGAVSHRLNKIAKRIKYLMKQPQVHDIDKFMSARFEPPIIAMCKVFCSCQNQKLTAEILEKAQVPLPWHCSAKRWSQIIVRHAWIKVLNCCSHDSDLKELSRYFEYVDLHKESHPTSYQPICAATGLHSDVQQRLASTAPWFVVQGSTGAQGAATERETDADD